MNGFMPSSRQLPLERDVIYSDPIQSDVDIEPLFDADALTRYTSLAVDRLAQHISDSTLRGLALSDPALVLASAAKLTQDGDPHDAEGHMRKLGQIIDLYARTGIQVYSPGYMGRQFSGPLPVSAVVDLVSAVLTQPASFYEAGQLPNVAERIMGEELNRFLGFPADSFTMVTTSGGSLANLTAILAARNRRYPDAWRDGLAGNAARPAIAVGEDVHYSVTRAAGILGIGDGQIVRLPLDAERRIDPARVRSTLDAAAARGLDVFCLVASAGSTSTGAIDPFDVLADIAAERGLWLHVDGAHGASLLVSDQLRPRLRGIERVDSLAWDAHKTMFVPAVCTMLFYRDEASAVGAFHQEASYVFEKSADIYTAFDAANKNFECTKRPMIMSLWVPWALYGSAPFAEKLEQLCAMTADARAILAQAVDFVPLHRPHSNILCFRYLPKQPLDDFALGKLQSEIRTSVRARGRFFISKVDLDGQAALRVVFMNHRITADHFHQLLDEIREVAGGIVAERAEPKEILA
jgi:L-2,4-diaminobutyrate decarboxylase